MILSCIKKRILLCLAALTVSGAFATPVSEHGQLSLSGYKVVDKNGNPFVLRGMSLFWDIWGYESFYNSNVVSTLANNWGANVVRAAIAEYNTSRAKSMIDYANSNGIYIIVDNHSHCAHRATSQATSFFSDVSSYVKQKGYVNVIYEIYNEPLYENCNGATDTQSGGSLTSWTTIKSYAETVIRAIRNNDPNGIIVVGTPNYSQGTESARANPITGYSNIAYTLHFYASSSGHGALRYNLLHAKCNDFPVFITEWGVSESSGAGRFDTDMTKAWMSWVETLGIGWANWSINDKGETSSALNSGAGSGGNWADYQLSASGKYVKNLIKGLNSGGTLASVGLEEANTDCSLLDGGSSSVFTRTGIVKFDYGFEAEDYLTISNAKTVEFSKASNKTYVDIQQQGTKASLVYSVYDVAGAGYYAFSARVAANTPGYITYTVEENNYTDSVAYEATGGTDSFVWVKGLIKIPDIETMGLKVEWSSDVALDMMSVRYARTTDSVDFGLLEIDDAGNRTIHIPENDEYLHGIEANSGLDYKASVHFVGRNLMFEGIRSVVTVGVFDLQGRVMLKRQVQGTGALDLSGLHAGAYVVRLKGAGVSETKRIQLR